MRRHPVLIVSALQLFSVSAFAQGTLTPPGPPAPTMKTLDQVEPRIPVDASHTPGSDAADFVIAQPGSYYFIGNITATKSIAITIAASNVTLDLNGFALRGGGNSSVGILLNPGANLCTVKNGSISGFSSDGVTASGGSDTVARGGTYRQLLVRDCGAGLSAGVEWLVESCNVTGSTGGSTFGWGILTGDGSLVVNCVANNNSGMGIYVQNECMVKDCVMRGNNGEQAVYTGFRSAVLHCDVTDNVLSSDASSGIYTGGHSSVIGCTVGGNKQASGVTSTAATGRGIVVGTESSVRDCSVGFNSGDGIRVSGSTLVANNTCTSNGKFGAQGAGIHVSGNGNRIEGNTAVDNTNGYKIDAGGNLIVKNSNRGGVANGAFVFTGGGTGGNSVGEMVNVFNGGAGATIDETTSAWANLLY